ncbi:MAG: hypothetical protein DCE92_01940 [Alphaproteobacteria bacterium]|nr:MAG: hypothetical protein DCE92_01940 [Alphaproteobacteria bacterium]
MTIPIHNLYYLFCYAWQRFPDSGVGEVGVEDAPDLPNLLAKILIADTNRLLRRGLDRGYQAMIEETRAPRGRMMLDLIVKAQTLRRGTVICAIDELTPDVVHNQILKATARSMARSRGLHVDHKHALAVLVQRLGAVSDIRLTGGVFARLQLTRNSRHYRPLMRLCEFVFRMQMPLEGEEGSRFADVLRDDVTMSAVFEEFLFNFYAHEQKVYRVGSEQMSWDAVPLDEGSAGVLPLMITDITLRSRSRTIVMDAKYYSKMLAAWNGSGKVRSGHLYQLFSYMEHAGIRTPDLPCDGALIYPAVGEAVRLAYRIRGHDVVVQSIDFNQPWPQVHNDLLVLLDRFSDTPSVSANTSMRADQDAVTA